MTAPSTVLAVDLGTSGAKAAIFSESGAVLASAFRRTSLQLLPGGGAEQDPGEWWQAILEASEQCLNTNGVDRSSVRAIGVTAQWSGTVAMDGDGQPLHP